MAYYIAAPIKELHCMSYNDVTEDAHFIQPAAEQHQGSFDVIAHALRYLCHGKQSITARQLSHSMQPLSWSLPGPAATTLCSLFLSEMSSETGKLYAILIPHILRLTKSGI